MSIHQHPSSASGKSPRRSSVLNIPELAKRGGLPSSITSYIVEEDDKGAYIRSFGSGTTTVNECVITGLVMEGTSARHYAECRPGCTVETIARMYPNVAALLSDRELEERIITQSFIESDTELAWEIYERHEKQNPILETWKPTQPESPQDRATRRQEKLNPLLEHLALSRNDWAVQAGVQWHTVNKFMIGITVSLSPVTRRRLAEALGLDFGDFPA